MKSISFAQGVDQIIQEFELSTHYPPKVLSEAELLSEDSLGHVISGRVDLRKEKVVTIDGETARDFDDAVSVQQKPNGHFILKVSIADVSYYVSVGSALDHEAYRRATSVYFPDRVLPMFPERLSNDLCSLVPRRDRLTVTAEMEFDPKGKKIASRFYRSVIRSFARLTYTEVRKVLLDRDPALRKRHEPLIADLELMADLAERMRQRRFARGSLDFDLPEPEIVLDLEEGGIDKIVKAERNLAHRLIEEFMIAANESVASFLRDRKAPAVYRIHPSPTPEKIKDFVLLLHNLGIPFRKKRSFEPRDFSRILDFVRGGKEEKIINGMLVKTLERAIYNTKNVGHFGLASECYTHFTSPIRRYPDLMVHRALCQLMGVVRGRAGSPPNFSERPRRFQGGAQANRLEEEARHCSERERVAMKAEWASRDLAAAFFMKDKEGEKFPAIISGMTKFGFFVEISPYYVQGLVPLRSLKDDYYVLRSTGHEIVGLRKKRRFRLGEPITVILERVNLEKRWIDFSLAK
ncbi:MAG: ribonuclease R [Deltaproteobacteria bacterium]|nr:ribonuclease R [Deltaproteobacteria bacterium]